MTVKLKLGRLSGLSSDTKPAAASTPAGTGFIETDTRKQYYNDGTNWILQELPTYKKYKVFKVGATTFVTDINGKVVQSNTDTQVAVQAQIDTMTNPSLYEFLWDADAFTLNNPIIHPTISQSQIKTVKHNGVFMGWRLTGGGATRLSASTSFPTDRYMFELNNPGSTSTTTGSVIINGFQADNINNLGTKNVGFCKLEAGNVINGFATFVMQNVFCEYIWRVLHLIGAIWFGRFENIFSYENSASFIGDNVLMLEDGGHTGSTNPTPKSNIFRACNTMHVGGSFNNFVRIKSGGYNWFENNFVNGNKYQSAVYNLDNTDVLTIHNNTFRDNTVIDLITVPAPDNRLGNLYMAGTSVFDNVFLNHRAAPWTGAGTTIRLGSTGVERNYIEIPAYFGAVTQINDTGSGQSNTIRIITGGSKIGGTEAPISHIGGLSRIIDDRRGAEKAGTAVISDGGTITHGLFSTPVWAFVQSRLAGEFASVTARSTTTITVAIKKHDNAAGTASQTVDWRAGVYA